MISNTCIFCDTFDAPVVIQENGYNGKKCDRCNLIYVSPRPTLQAIANLYGHDQAHISATQHIALQYPKTLHAAHTLAIIKQYVKQGDLLELGAGAGFFLQEAKRNGFSPYGIELNPVQATFINNKLQIPCRETPLTKGSFDNKTFDVIYHSDVLSHFYDPIDAMQTIREKLNPQGYVIFETGNIADIDSKYYRDFPAMQYPDHLFFFGRKSLERLLSQAHFSLKEYRSYGILPQLKIMRLVRTLKQRQNTAPYHKKAFDAQSSKKQTVLAKTVRTSYHLFMHSLRYGVGRILTNPTMPQTVIIVAQKNEVI